MDETNLNRLIGKKMIETAINLDESLAELLKIEVKRLKQLTKSDNALEELQRSNKLIKNIIMALTITDERIKTALELYFNSTESERS